MDQALYDASKEFLVRYGGDVFPNLFRSAKGTIVKDSDGREYLDFTSGQMCATIGHNHPAIVEAVHRAGREGVPLLQRHDPRSRGGAGADPGARLAARRSQAGRSSSTPAPRRPKSRCGWRRCTPEATRSWSLAAPGTASPAAPAPSPWRATARATACRRRASSSSPNPTPTAPISQPRRGSSRRSPIWISR